MMACPSCQGWREPSGLCPRTGNVSGRVVACGLPVCGTCGQCPAGHSGDKEGK